MQRYGLRQIVGLVLIALCVNVAPVAAQEWALPPLTDQVSAQFPAIGRLGQKNFRVKQGCTATLIAPDLILTAAHCLSINEHSENVFVAGWSREKYKASRQIVQEIRHPGYASNGAHDPRNDVGLGVLESPIENVTPIPPGEVENGTLYGTEVALIGYHAKYPLMLTGSFTCSVTRFWDGLLRVGCPVFNGNSGAPLLGKSRNGDWQVVGVVSSRIGAVAVAVELPEWLKRELTAHLQR